MVLDEIIAAMTPDLYQRLATAVETGKWTDGVALTPEQKENSLHLVLLWQARHNDSPQHMTVAKGGELVIKSKKQLKDEFNIADDNLTHIRLQ
ncbi:DUF1315 family protein [Erwinia tracheiphila]|uniref:DUF1315 family protein n=1 Tax=Erwinia tracheiphila TaxID=65700 RepID=A0A0M2KB45_9GAMM|nr:DUF1315 family protein [Erwinia tracheiphila]EOS93412.1 hypothetical protein ETR_19106 [Erwinia tracheiphila PSU-1]KKF34497.1 hypothetical protein SY86_01930 [Erwinia tracheiphila]UIA86167.1 DUF1315 family protein [Erwinia tracheiphila]UIA98383.1 DUF1315 family protein [Erwinia tracheiphila]